MTDGEFLAYKRDVAAWQHRIERQIDEIVANVKGLADVLEQIVARLEGDQ